MERGHHICRGEGPKSSNLLTEDERARPGNSFNVYILRPPSGAEGAARTRGVSKVDMELNEASHGGVQELSVDYDINSAADYNFWPAQDG